jgi:carbon storage regulator
MNIVTVSFEEPLVFCIRGEIIQVVAFKTPEHGNIKFGINAPRSINVHREEIYLAIKKQQTQETTLDSSI